MIFSKRLSLLLLALSISTSAFAADGNGNKKYLFAFGPGFFTNLNSNGMATVLKPGLNWTLSESFDLAITTDIGISLKHSDVLFLSPQLHGNYFLSPQNANSYFVGFGMGYGYSKSHGNLGRGSHTAGGFAVGGAFGFKAFRDGDINLAVALEHKMIIDESQSGTPLFTYINVTVYFNSL